MRESDAIIGLGANLGARMAAFRAAIDLIDATPECRAIACSNVYDTAPWGPPQPRYLNAAIRVTTTLAPEPLLDALLDIERRIGLDRTKKLRWGPRPLDLDLLVRTDGPFRSDRLVVPHPRLEERTFALAPLLDVAPEMTAYAERLEELGGAPPAMPLAPLPAVREGCVETADDPEGWAAAMTVLAREVGPALALQERTFDGHDADDLAKALESALNGGFGVRWVVLPTAEPGRIDGRLLGAPADKRPIAIASTPTTDGRRRWSLRAT